MSIIPAPHVPGGFLGLEIQTENPGAFGFFRNQCLFGKVWCRFGGFLSGDDFAERDMPQEAFEDQSGRLFVKGFITVPSLW